MKHIKIETTQYDGQEDGADTVIVEMENGNTWEVQRINGFFSQLHDCQLSKNGVMNPEYDEEAEFVVALANEAE